MATHTTSYMERPMPPHRYHANAEHIEVMLKHACLPNVGKVATFGHQYAFARAPAWFKGEVCGGVGYGAVRQGMKCEVWVDPSWHDV